MHCDVAGIPLHFEVRGHGRPIVFLHGSPSDHARAMAMFEPAIRGNRGWRRVYPDLPGHGKTPGSPRIRDTDDYLKVVVEFVDHLTRNGSFCVAGHSFGAYLALGVARKRPRRVKGLLLSAPEIWHNPREDRMEGASRGRNLIPNDLARQGPGYHEDTAWLTNLPWMDVSFDLYDGTPVKAPTLLLFGRQDSSFRYLHYSMHLTQFPNATYAILDGAGHSLWKDRPSLSAVLVRDWLERVRKSAGGKARER